MLSYDSDVGLVENKYYFIQNQLYNCNKMNKRKIILKPGCLFR